MRVATIAGARTAPPRDGLHALRQVEVPWILEHLPDHGWRMSPKFLLTADAKAVIWDKGEKIGLVLLYSASDEGRCAFFAITSFDTTPRSLTLMLGGAQFIERIFQARDENGDPRCETLRYEVSVDNLATMTAGLGQLFVEEDRAVDENGEGQVLLATTREMWLASRYRRLAGITASRGD